VADYARRPLNLVLLVVVPVVIVFVWGPSLADFSKLFGGSGDRAQIEAATAGWAAAALAGLAGFFQVTGAGATDRRLAAAAGRSFPVVAGRLSASLGLAMVAATGGLITLAARTGIAEPFRAVAATTLIAIIYLALGVLVGTVVKTEMNGALLVTLAWVFDVFLGPAMGSGPPGVTRLFPLHFPTLLLTGQATGHAGPLGDVGWSLVDGGRHFTAFLSERRIHAATMVPVTSAFLAGLTGLFMVTGSAGGDRRLVLDGFRSREVLAGRLGVVAAATVLTTAVAWGAFLPARGASRVMLDGAFTEHFDELRYLLLGLAWLTALTAASSLLGRWTRRLSGRHLCLCHDAQADA